MLGCAALCVEEMSFGQPEFMCRRRTQFKANGRFCRWVLSFPLAHYGFCALCWERRKELPWNIDRENMLVNGGRDVWASPALGDVRPGTQAVLQLLGRVYAAEIKPHGDARLSFGNSAQEITDAPQLFLLRVQHH